MGVQLPAQSVLCGNDAVIRSLLVHEFSHCFFVNVQAFNAYRAGVGAITDLLWDPMDDAEDRKRMIDVTEWFGPEECEAMVYHDSDAIVAQAIHAAIARLRGTIRTTRRPLRDSEFSLTLTGGDDIWSHIEKLSAVPKEE
jgi:hypothetical protein